MSLKLQFSMMLPLKLLWNISDSFILTQEREETAKELCFTFAFLKVHPLKVEKSKKHWRIEVSAKVQLMNVHPLRKQECSAFPWKEKFSKVIPSKQRSRIKVFSFMSIRASSAAFWASRLCLRHRSEPLKIKFEQWGMLQHLKENIRHYTSESFFLIDRLKIWGKKSIMTVWIKGFLLESMQMF